MRVGIVGALPSHPSRLKRLSRRLLLTLGPWNLSSSTQLLDRPRFPFPPKKVKLLYVGSGGNTGGSESESRLTDLDMAYLRLTSRFVKIDRLWSSTFSD